LVEVLVAMSVFAVVLVGLTGVLISGVRSVGDQRLRTAATRVAIDHLETLRGLPIDQLDGQAGTRTVTTADGRAFTIETTVARIDSASGLPATAGAVRQITALVRWVSNGASRQVSYTTAIAPTDAGPTAAAQAIGTITMFPSPAVTDAFGRPEADIQVTVPLVGFAADALVHLSWTNADGTAGAKTLTSTTGLNWRGTIAKEQLLARIGTDGRGEVQFRAAAGSLVAVYTLAMQRAAASPPAITSASIDRNPVTVAKRSAGRSCGDRNQCQNTTDVVFTLTTTGLDPTQDSVILQYQLYDGTFREVPLTPAGGQWRLTIRQKTTKFLAGTARGFRFTAIRTADGATAAMTVERDVVRT
jgi:type II secretory pathway pseudopilin PulG